jgi:hypothetical protein
VSQQELEGLCYEWQRILRLQDWKISIQICRMRDMDDAYGRTLVHRNWKEAEIKICDPIDRKSPDDDCEQTLVHELVHLHFVLATPDGGDSLCVFEQGIDLTAWALLNLKRRVK